MPAPFYIDAHHDVPWLQTKRLIANTGSNDFDTDPALSFNILDGDPSSIFTRNLAQQAGLSSAIFALYLSDGLQDQMGPDLSWKHILRQVSRLVQGPGVVTVKNVSHAKTVLVDYGLEYFPVMLALEGGRLIQEDLDKLRFLAKKSGIRYLTLTHNKNTSWADSATDSPVHYGLGVFGYAVVKECNKLGVLVDVSHASDTTAWDAIAISARPVIASHSGARSLVNNPRNLPDDLICAIADKGGIICVPYAKRFIGHYKIYDHIRYIAELVGIHRVGIGSDIDGAKLVDGFTSVAQWRDVVMNDMVHDGLTESTINLILGGNLARVLEAEESYVASQSNPTDQSSNSGQ